MWWNKSDPPPQSLWNHLTASSAPASLGLSSASTVDDVLGKIPPSSVQGKVFYVLGATSPIGRALVESLCLRGARLVLGCRSLEAGEALADAVLSLASASASASATSSSAALPPSSFADPRDESRAAFSAASAAGEKVTKIFRPLVVHCDVSTIGSALAGAEAFKALGLPLDVLILGASISTGSFHLSGDGYEQMFQTNHLGQVVVAQSLLPLLAKDPRVVGATAAASDATVQQEGQMEQEGVSNQGDVGEGEGKKPEVANEPQGSALGTAPPAGPAGSDNNGGPEGMQPSAAQGRPSLATPIPPPSDYARGRIVLVSCSIHHLSPKVFKISGLPSGPSTAPLPPTVPPTGPPPPSPPPSSPDPPLAVSPSPSPPPPPASPTVRHLLPGYRGRLTPWSWRSLIQGSLGADLLFMPFQSLGLSKLAMVIYGRQLARHLRDDGIPVDVVSVHPGLTSAGMERFASPGESSWQGWAQKLAASTLSGLRLTKTPRQAAASIAYAALAPIVPEPGQMMTMMAAPAAAAASAAGGAAAAGCAIPSAAAPVPSSDAAMASAAAASPSEPATAPPPVPQGEAPHASRMAFRSGSYIEDCRVSLPSSEALDPVEGAALWQVTQEIIIEIGQKNAAAAAETTAAAAAAGEEGNEAALDQDTKDSEGGRG